MTTSTLKLPRADAVEARFPSMSLFAEDERRPVMRRPPTLAQRRAHDLIYAALLEDLRDALPLTDAQASWIARLVNLEFTGVFPQMFTAQWAERYAQYAQIYLPQSDEDTRRPGVPTGIPDVQHLSADMEGLWARVQLMTDFVHRLEDDQSSKATSHRFPATPAERVGPSHWRELLNAEHTALIERQTAIRTHLWAHLAACFPTLDAEQHAILRRCCDPISLQEETFVLTYHALASHFAPVDQARWARLGGTELSRTFTLQEIWWAIRPDTL